MLSYEFCTFSKSTFSDRAPWMTASDDRTFFEKIVNPVQDGTVLLTDEGVTKRLPFLKICHTNPTKMKLGTVIPYL